MKFMITTASRFGNRGFDIFFEARQQVEFYDDVLPCLHRLKQKFRLGSITNGNASVPHVGLGDLIEHAVSASDLMVAKPVSLDLPAFSRAFRGVSG